MKKVYFKDLDTKTKIDIIMENEDLYNRTCEELYERNMEDQLEQGNLMFGSDHTKYIDIRDYYSSFYLVLKDWYKFINNLDSDYLCQDGIDLYNQIIPLKEQYENLDCFSEEFNELEDKLETLCKELLEICEKQLHEYENYNNEDIKEFLEYMFEDNNYLENYYILGNDTKTVYEDIRYTKSYK